MILSPAPSAALLFIDCTQRNHRQRKSFPPCAYINSILIHSSSRQMVSNKGGHQPYSRYLTFISCDIWSAQLILNTFYPNFLLLLAICLETAWSLKMFLINTCVIIIRIILLNTQCWSWSFYTTIQWGNHTQTNPSPAQPSPATNQHHVSTTLLA